MITWIAGMGWENVCGDGDDTMGMWWNGKKIRGNGVGKGWGQFILPCHSLITTGYGR